MVEVIFDKAAFIKLKVDSISAGINAFPKWLKNCKTVSQVEEALEIHDFDFEYIEKKLLMVLPKEKSGKDLANISFKVIDDAEN